MSRDGIRPLYTLRQVVKALGMHRETVMKLFAEHDIRVVRVGYRVYVPLSEIEAKLEILWKSLVLAERTKKSCRARAFS
jgi:excisionase family DNA binding protein